MKNWYISKLQPALIYSGIIAGIFIVYTIIIDVLSANFTTLNMVGTWVVLLGGIAYAMYAYRKEFHQNAISYGKVFGFGMLVALILSIVLIIFNYIYITFINPDIIQLGKDYAEQKMIDKGLSEDMIQRGMETSERFSKPPLVFIMGFLQYMVFFTIFSLIAAAFIKKEASDPFANIK